VASTTQQLLLAEFRSLFTGNKTNYGVHQYAYAAEGKEEGKNSTVTNKLLTGEQYKNHLMGKVGLGIIPIDEEGECQFGVIDIDMYEDLSMYIDAIEHNNFPLVPFRSKSGGLHLYLFLKAPAQAKIVVDVMNNFVILLGLDLLIKRKLNRMIEVFPKQLKVQEKGVGNWINLPYYDSQKTRQPAMRGGQQLSLDEGIAYAKDKRRSLSELRSFLHELPGTDGPPCLQTIQFLNIMEKNSGRNNYLFSLGVYLKKKDEQFWEQKLFEANSAMKAPLSRDELESTIISSLRKKDFSYKCLEVPCVDFCRRPLCKTRNFGVGKEGGYFSELEYGKMYQIRTYEPYYEWEVKGPNDKEFKLLRFKNEEEVIRQDAFLRLCFRELHILPIKMKQSEWFKLVNQSLQEVEVRRVAKEDEISPFSLLKSLFIDFLLNRAMAHNKEQILNRRVYHDKSRGAFYFRATDLNDYLFISKGFRMFSPTEVHGILKDIRATAVRIKTETGKQIRVYEIAQQAVDELSQSTNEQLEAQFKKEGEEF
jgi:hypothetical protein